MFTFTLHYHRFKVCPTEQGTYRYTFYNKSTFAFHISGFDCVSCRSVRATSCSSRGKESIEVRNKEFPKGDFLLPHRADPFFLPLSSGPSRLLLFLFVLLGVHRIRVPCSVSLGPISGNKKTKEEKKSDQEKGATFGVLPRDSFP